VVISRPRSSSNNSSRFIDFGQDSGGSHNGTLYLVDNTLVAGTSSIGFLQMYASEAKIVATNNIFYGSSNVINANYGSITGTNNWMPSTATVGIHGRNRDWSEGSAYAVCGTDALSRVCALSGTCALNCPWE
jgi:hypothetical protein